MLGYMETIVAVNVNVSVDFPVITLMDLVYIALTQDIKDQVIQKVIFLFLAKCVFK